MEPVGLTNTKIVKSFVNPVAQQVNQDRGDQGLAVAEPDWPEEHLPRNLNRQDGGNQDEEVERAPGDGVQDGHGEQGPGEVLVRVQEELVSML